MNKQDLVAIVFVFMPFILLYVASFIMSEDVHSLADGCKPALAIYYIVALPLMAVVSSGDMD